VTLSGYRLPPEEIRLTAMKFCIFKI